MGATWLNWKSQKIRRFLMKRVGEGWKIDAVQERLNGWQRTEV